jgi:hypothetical protein
MTIRWLLILGLLTAVQDGGRKPPPDAAAQKESEKVLRDIFKDDYAKKAPADRAALAAKLVDQARRSTDDRTAQFVLFREAQDLYGQAGDADAAFKTIDEWSRLFAIDPVEAKSGIAAALARTAKTPDELRALISAQLKVADEAVAADQYPLAEKSAASALAAAKKAMLTSPASRATSKLKEVADLKSRFEKVKRAKETLAANAEDPAANLTVGQFYCAAKGNWESGLPLLAKGSDATLKALAARELAQPGEAAEQGAIGDGWWDLSEKETGSAKENLKRHAIALYQQASGKAVGLNKAKIDKRIADSLVDRLYKGSWQDISDPKLFNRPGKPGDPVELPKPSECTLNMPAGDFDGLQLRVLPSDDVFVHIEYELKAHAIDINGTAEKFNNMRIEGNSSRIDQGFPCPRKEEHKILVLLGDGEWIVYRDNQEIFRARTNAEKLPGLRLLLLQGKVKVDQIKLRRRD